MMPPIESIEDLSALLLFGVRDFSDYGMVNTTTERSKILFNYTRECNFKPPEEWNTFERMSRGLIMDMSTGDVLARPFDKFFNYGQIYPKSTDKIQCVTEKYDGSLIIYYHEEQGWRCATRGSFVSEQAHWAGIFIAEEKIAGAWSKDLTLSPNWTYLFEAIYPENRIVVDYGPAEKMVLLGIRNRYTGEYLPYSDMEQIAHAMGPNVEVPQLYAPSDIKELAETADTLSGQIKEGFVVTFDSGLRIKVKGADYLRLHRFKAHHSFKRVLEALQEHKLDEYLAVSPEEYHAEIYRMAHYILSSSIIVQDQVRAHFMIAPKGSRKEFALWVQENCPHIAKYMYKMLDGETGIADLVLQNEEFNDPKELSGQDKRLSNHQ